MFDTLNKEATFTEALPYLVVALIMLLIIGVFVYCIKNHNKQYDLQQKKIKSWKTKIDKLCESINDPIVYRWSTMAVIFDQNNKVVHLRFINKPEEEKNIKFEKITSIERIESGRITSRVDIGSALIAGPLYANRVLTSEQNLTGIRLMIDDLSDPIVKISAEPYSNKESFLKLCVAFETIVKSNAQNQNDH